MNRFLLLVFLCCFQLIYSQQTEYVDFKKIKADIGFKDINKVSGFIDVEFTIKKETDSIFMDAVGMNIRTQRLVSKKDGYLGHGNYHNDGKRIYFINNFKENETYVMSFWYSAAPKKALYFVDNQIWTQGQGKYTSNWLPSIDDVNDKIEFDLTIGYDKDYQVIANGELLNVVDDDSTKTWHFNMNQPMSSYLVALAIGNYNKQTETSASG